VDTVHVCDRRTDRQAELVGAYARAQLLAGYTVNTHEMVARYGL